MAGDKYDKKESGGKGVGLLIAILIIVTWLSVMALLVKCDVGGFGSKVLRPVFKDIPIIRGILPEASDEEVAIESDYPYKNLDSALERIKVLDADIGSKTAEIASLNDKVAELEAEVSRLKIFEDEQINFENKKNQFYNEIVYGEMAPDADTYIEWYNTLDAEYAEKIYREILEAKQVDKEILDLAASYESMDSKKAAKILESMKNDLDTVALIMNNIGAEAQGKILAEMEPDYAALVTKKMLP